MAQIPFFDNQAWVSIPKLEMVKDDKYIVFKRDEFYQLMGELALPPWVGANGEWLGDDLDCAPLADHINKRAEEACVADAVVIRRQDLFAPPALDAYANAIDVAISLTPYAEMENLDVDVPEAFRRVLRLREVADYFHRQAVLAWDAERKLPD